MHTLLMVLVFVIWPPIVIWLIVHEQKSDDHRRNPKDYEKSNW